MRKAKNSIRVLVVGQTPPPFHGQSIMIQMLVDGPMDGVEVCHLRMAFSDKMDQVGRFQVGKIIHLVYLIFAIFWLRIRYRIQVLYFPPAGPNRIPLIRDTLLLLPTRWLFKKTVFHFQASGVSELIVKLPAWQRFFVMRAMIRPDAAIQLSALTVADAKFFDAKRTYYIPNAADDFVGKKLPIRTHDGDGLKTRILYVGTVCETKGILVLLDALASLHGELKSIHLDIVGSFQPSSFEAVVRRKIDSLNLSSDVSVHGQRIGDEKWTMFANADLFCFPTYYESEGFPCVLVEAMSFSLPVISTRWRGIPSIVADGETGYLVDIRDIEGLASRIARLASDDSLREAMGKRARARYETEFTRPMHLQQMSQVFLDVANATTSESVSA